MTFLSCVTRYLRVYGSSKVIARKGLDGAGDWWAGRKMVTAVNSSSVWRYTVATVCIYVPFLWFLQCLRALTLINDIELLEPLLKVACLLCRAVEHSVDLPGVFVFPSWRMRTPTVLPVSKSTEELLLHINTALLHPMVIESLSKLNTVEKSQYIPQNKHHMLAHRIWMWFLRCIKGLGNTSY